MTELTFKSPDQIASEYLLELKNLKSDVNDKQTDSDWFIKSKVYGGVVAGAYSDQRKVADDAFPQSARREALEKHSFVYFNEGLKQPTQSNGSALFTGATGSTVSAGIELIYDPNGNAYVTDEEKVIEQATGVLVSVQSVDTGQDQNLLDGAELTVQAPPAGVDSTATVTGGNLADGSDEETDQAAAERILARIREPIRGGTEGDYEQWALEASDAVTRATILRFPNGLGTVGVVITAGTTDIDSAIDNDEPIVIVPSTDLISEVKAYIDDLRPLTDCVRVFPPIEVAQDVEVKVRFAQGDKDTILSGQTKTQGELVEREVRRALYNHPVGGYKFGASGYVVASRIEEVIDLNLSTEPFTQGANPIVLDRQVLELSATGFNRTLLVNEAAIPGTITITEF